MGKRYAKFGDKVYLIDKTNNEKIVLKNDNITLETSIDKIEIMPENFKLTRKNNNWSIKTYKKDISNEIMLRHMTKDEALNALDKYIDQAIIAKHGRIKIIHGRHGGILKKAVHEYLLHHPFVKEYYLASYGEGDIGVTIAILGKK